MVAEGADGSSCSKTPVVKIMLRLNPEARNAQQFLKSNGEFSQCTKATVVFLGRYVRTCILKKRKKRVCIQTSHNIALIWSSGFAGVFNWKYSIQWEENAAGL